MPDTLFQEYESRSFDEIVVSPDCDVIGYHHIFPVEFKSSDKSIITKYIYEDCNDCVYEEYIDSLEIRPSYDEIFVQTEYESKYDHRLKISGEWAWVKLYEEIPKDHNPCLDVVGIDTCLWKYVAIQEAKYDTFLRVKTNFIFDTVKVSPTIIPIKKYRLKNKSSQEVEKLILINTEQIPVQLYTIEKEAYTRYGHPGGCYRSRPGILKSLIKAVTPLNYSD